MQRRNYNSRKAPRGRRVAVTSRGGRGALIRPELPAGWLPPLVVTAAGAAAAPVPGHPSRVLDLRPLAVSLDREPRSAGTKRLRVLKRGGREGGDFWGGVRVGGDLCWVSGEGCISRRSVQRGKWEPEAGGGTSGRSALAGGGERLDLKRFGCLRSWVNAWRWGLGPGSGLRGTRFRSRAGGPPAGYTIKISTTARTPPPRSSLARS
jgi:hypothetical protein